MNWRFGVCTDYFHNPELKVECKIAQVERLFRSNAGNDEVRRLRRHPYRLPPTNLQPCTSTHVGMSSMGEPKE